MIEATGVTKRYGARAVLTDVSLVARDGAVTGFVGPNGAGKSTLMKIAAGLAAADSGEVLVDGAPIQSAARPASTLGTFLSAETIPGQLTTRSYLRYVCQTQRIPIERADELLELVGLGAAAGMRVKACSLGMRQRLGIAAALADDPRNLILDEPVNGLDPDGIRWLRGFLAHLAADGRAVLLSSHHMAELGMIADEVVVLGGGVVTRRGRIEDFTRSPDRAVLLRARDTEAALRALADAGLDASARDGDILVRGADPIDVGAIAFAASAGVSHLSEATRSLEDSYFETIQTGATA